MTAPPQFATIPPSSMAAEQATAKRASTRHDSVKPHITDTPITRANWYKHVNWLNVFLIVGIPIYGLIAAIWTPLVWKTAVFTVLYYFATGLGITAGMCCHGTLLRLVIVSRLTLN
jgi:stearoyl-CoA desaturase (delta-9 desaturase)